MTVRTLLLRALAALAVLLGIVGLSAGPAAAANEIGLSTDGVHWSAALPGPLFDPSFRWVPGDSQTATFYVRNQAPDSSVMSLTMLTGPVETLIDTGDLTVGASVDGGAFADATTAGSHLLVNQVPVGSGEIKRIVVKVTFDPASTNQSQLRQLDLRFAVQLSEEASVLPPTGGGTGGPSDGGGSVSPPGGGGLPDTGTLITPAMLVVSALLVSAGLFLVGWGRRRKGER